MKRGLFCMLICACAASNEAAPSATENTEREQEPGAASGTAQDDASSVSGGNGSMPSSPGMEGPGASARSDQARGESGGAANSADGEAGASDEGTGEAGAADEGATMGEAGASGAGGSTGEGGASMDIEPTCPTPPGEDVAAIEYEPGANAAGCNLQTQRLQPDQLSSVNVESEAEFVDIFGCPAGAASGIDFETQLLRVTVIREAGFVAPTRLYAREAAGVVQLGFSVPRYCGGPFPPTSLLLTLLPAGTEAVEDEVCRPGDCGAGGFPP